MGFEGRIRHLSKFVDGLPYCDMMEPLLGCIHRRSAQGARTIFMNLKVRAHKGLPVNKVADDCAAKGNTSEISLWEAMEL